MTKLTVALKAVTAFSIYTVHFLASSQTIGIHKTGTIVRSLRS